MGSSNDKELCEWSKKDYSKNWDKLRAIVAEPRFICQKCGRGACDKKWLCKGKPM